MLFKSLPGLVTYSLDCWYWLTHWMNVIRIMIYNSYSVLSQLLRRLRGCACLCVVFLCSRPESPVLQELSTITNEHEGSFVTEHDIYLHLGYRLFAMGRGPPCLPIVLETLILNSQCLRAIDRATVQCHRYRIPHTWGSLSRPKA